MSWLRQISKKWTRRAISLFVFFVSMLLFQSASCSDNQSDNQNTSSFICSLSGHTDEVFCLAFSPNGKTLASGSKDETIKIWDLPSGEERTTLSGHKGMVVSLAFSPDGQTLASGSTDCTVRLWDIASSKQSRMLAESSDAVWQLAFSPDGEELICRGEESIIIWDIETGCELKSYLGYSGRMRSVVTLRSGRILALMREGEKRFKLWDVTEGRDLFSLPVHEIDMWSVAFSPLGELMASASFLGSIKIYDISSGQIVATLPGHSSEVVCMSFSPNGDMLASGSDKADPTVKVWNIGSGEILATLSGHVDVVNAVVFSPDGQKAASASVDKTIRIWDVSSLRE